VKLRAARLDEFQARADTLAIEESNAPGSEYPSLSGMYILVIPCIGTDRWFLKGMSKYNRKCFLAPGNIRFLRPRISLRTATRQKIVQVMTVVVQLVSNSQLFAEE
jgi:hypothetical protein